MSSSIQHIPVPIVLGPKGLSWGTLVAPDHVASVREQLALSRAYLGLPPSEEAVDRSVTTMLEHFDDSLRPRGGVLAGVDGHVFDFRLMNGTTLVMGDPVELARRSLDPESAIAEHLEPACRS